MKTFKEFWPYYLNEHSNKINRRLHFVGTAIIHVLFVYVVFTSKFKILWFAPLVGYSFAWVGHFLIEKNRPATIQYPIWSLIADFKMFYLMMFNRI